ncbi:MAG: glycoside hydrolase family 13 protein [Oscillospiraceae bacterium]
MERKTVIIMEMFHDSQYLKYRNPFGAVQTETAVKLGLKIINATKPIKVEVRLWINGVEHLSDMTETTYCGDEYFYTIDIDTPKVSTLVWYYFVATTEDRSYYYSNNKENLGGVGEMTEFPTNNSYQITVYDKSYKTPNWFKNKIMYQIFTDRFYGEHEGEIPKKRDEYVTHHDWYAPLSFNDHPYEKGPACNDFYGGNLKGIIKKLPYLKDLGIGVIYLNPVFDAYSNHKYDTADYKTIDPMFGTNEIFEELCQKAEDVGIRIILDGVFSHTGADSIYFNKYKNYGNGGAYNDPGSQYRSWYQFTKYPEYKSWWGCNNLPNVNEMNEGYLDYILRDDDAVIKKWLRHGAFGWRLDVADELPDKFIKILRKEVKKANPEAVIIGEVWEDASNKRSYDVPREYLFGDELDSVMNYPFKHNVVAFLLGTINAKGLNKRMMSLVENYPKEALYSLMNIAGTHDTLRIKTAMGEMTEDCGTAKLSSGGEKLATHRVKIMAFIQMTFFGVPCIYYGDEVGMQGGKDPFNRGTYPWRNIDPDLQSWYKTLANIRNTNSCLRCGEFLPLLAEDDVYVYARYNNMGKNAFGKKTDNGVMICAVNRSFETQKIEVNLTSLGVKALIDMQTGKKIPLDYMGVLKIEIMPLGCILLSKA